MNHDCIHQNRLERLERIVFGNGKPGLLEDSHRLSENVKNLDENLRVQNKHLEKLGTSVSSVAKFTSEFKTEIEAGQAARKSYQIKTRWLITIFISIVFGLASTLVAIIIK